MKGKQVLRLIDVTVIIVIVLWFSGILYMLPHEHPPAKSIVCSFNNRQISMAMWLYAEEHDNVLFPLNNEDDKYWFDTIIPYLEDEKMLWCPSAWPNTKQTDEMLAGSARSAWRIGGEEGGYGINGWLFPKGALTKENVSEEDSQKFYHNLDTKGTPAATVPLVGDANWFVSWPRATDTMPPDLQTGSPPNADPPNHMGRFCLERHGPEDSPFITIGFADGHAEKIELDKLWSLNWHKEFKTSEEPPTAKQELSP